jgi:hypothetical protein
MPELRGKIRWTIPGNGTAFSVLHFGLVGAGTAGTTHADEIITRMNAFITTVKPYIPGPVSMQALSEIEVIDIPTGNLESVINGTSVAAQFGTASGAATWAAAVGGVISWNTNGVRNGRRVRGRTFVVPLAGVGFDVDGTLGSGCMTALNSAATGLRTAGTLTELVVYNRPNPITSTPGDGHVVKSHRVPDMGAVLRSRRA